MHKTTTEEKVQMREKEGREELANICITHNEEKN